MIARIVQGIGAAATREESVILVPVTSERLTLGSDATDAHYLELVTRDTALMLLNRAPESLDYWMEQVLKVADPAAHGSFKAELVKIVDEQRGSDISQAFVISRMEVDPQALTAVVTGTLKTFVGAQVIASQQRRPCLQVRLQGRRRGSEPALRHQPRAGEARRRRMGRPSPDPRRGGDPVDRSNGERCGAAWLPGARRALAPASH